jgi:hypothetical protein
VNGTQPPQNLAGIKDGVLHVQVNLMGPNADIVAHGFLGKAAFMVEQFVAGQAVEATLAAAAKAE